MKKRYCFALDLKDDPQLILRYDWYHSKEGIWPEVLDSINGSGIELMQIFRTGNRLFMIMEVSSDFSLEEKKIMDKENLKIQKWEELMWRFQQALPWAKEGEKWVMMDMIFEVKEK